VVAFLTVKRVPACVIPNYQQFFVTFIPSSQTIATLKVLLALAVEINADMKWVAYLENPA
jgi:hypothetical protein